MYKKILIGLIIANLVSSLFLFKTYQENQEIKNDLLSEYIMTQININQLLHITINSYEKGKLESSFANLNQAAQEAKFAYKLLANGVLGKHIEPPYILSKYSKNTLILLNKTVNKIGNGDFNEDTLRPIRELSKEMERYVEQIDYEKLTVGKHMDRTFNQLEQNLKKSK